VIRNAELNEVRKNFIVFIDDSSARNQRQKDANDQQFDVIGK